MFIGPVPPIPAHIPAANRAAGAGICFTEVMDVGSGDIWLSLDAVTPADVAALVLGPSMVTYGPSIASMDVSWFDRSPGATIDGQLAERRIGGRTFRLVAHAGVPIPLPAGLGIEMMVDMHHAAGFSAGRSVDILVNPEGQFFVELAAAPPGAPPMVLPPGFSHRTLTLHQPWLLRVPRPARVYLLAPSARIFHGPITELPNERGK